MSYRNEVNEDELDDAEEKLGLFCRWGGFKDEVEDTPKVEVVEQPKGIEIVHSFVNQKDQEAVKPLPISNGSEARYHPVNSQLQHSSTQQQQSYHVNVNPSSVYSDVATANPPSATSALQYTKEDSGTTVLERVFSGLEYTRSQFSTMSFDNSSIDVQISQSGSEDLVYHDNSQPPRTSSTHRPSIVAHRLMMGEMAPPRRRSSFSTPNEHSLERNGSKMSHAVDSRLLWGGSGSSIMIARLSCQDEDFNVPPSSLSAVQNAYKQELGSEDFQQETQTYPDQLKVDELLSELGQLNGWYPEEIEHDVAILHKNRIRRVSDIRGISQQAWDEVAGLVPIVKDKIRQAVMQA